MRHSASLDGRHPIRSGDAGFGREFMGDPQQYRLAEPPGQSPAAEDAASYLPFRLACARSEAATDFAAFELFVLRRIFEAMLASRLLVVIRLHLLSAPEPALAKQRWLKY